MHKDFHILAYDESHTKGMLIAQVYPAPLSSDCKIMSFHKQFSDAVTVKTLWSLMWVMAHMHEGEVYKLAYLLSVNFCSVSKGYMCKVSPA